MKLVEILAKELGDWPARADNICQDASGCAYGWRGAPEWDCTYNDEWLCTESSDAIDRVEVELDLATDHDTAIVTREMWQAERERIAVEALPLAAAIFGAPQYDQAYPIQWRDRIREIDATVEAITAERAELVSKLAGEGFSLIVQTAEPVEDMGDWRNWRAGDLVECVDTCAYQFTKGQIYEVRSLGKYSVNVVFDDGGSTTNGWGNEKFKFHSRPSA